MAAKQPQFKLVFFVPPSQATECKDAVFLTGAGTDTTGKYSMTCFESRGRGQFKPNDDLAPTLGLLGQVQEVEELRIEIPCIGRDVVRKAVKALRQAHPYEEVAYEVYEVHQLEAL